MIARENIVMLLWFIKIVYLKRNKNTARGYSLFIHCSFNSNKNKHDYSTEKDYRKKLCANLKEHTTETYYCEKRKCYILQRKKKNHTRNKNFVTYAQNCSLRHLMKIKTVIRSGITVITHENIGTQRRVSEI